jgi:hypothetical protein
MDLINANRTVACSTKATAQAGAVTLIQYFGGSLNLNIRIHMIFLDGIYVGSVRQVAQIDFAFRS